MPNWCMNWMTVAFDGPVEDRMAVLDEVVEALRGEEGPLDFSRVIPLPESIDDGSGMDGYNWRVDNWGTKWNVHSDVTVERFADRVVYAFETAWSPPVPVADRFAELFPHVDVTLAFDERGLDFGGFVFWSGGKVEDQVEGGSRMTTWCEVADDRRVFG